MTAWLGQPLLDLDGIDLDAADRVSYVLWQRFCYAYDEPAYDVRQRLVAVPRVRHGGLHRRAHRVELDASNAAEDARRTGRVDRLGNLVVTFRLPVVAASVEFTVAALVERDGHDGEHLPAALLRDPWHLLPTRLTRSDEALRALADELRAATTDDADFAEAACERVGSGLEYGFGATSVRTTAPEAWAVGRGVCQDSAHVMLAICRAAGVPARYVSGHLLGQPGGSHAWVEVLVADGTGARAVAVDPSNGCRAGPRHLPVAVGRDYADVAPTSGWYRGGARGRLTCTKHAGVTAIDVV